MPIFQFIANLITRLTNRFIRRRPAYAFARQRHQNQDHRRFPKI